MPASGVACKLERPCFLGLEMQRLLVLDGGATVRLVKVKLCLAVL